MPELDDASNGSTWLTRLVRLVVRVNWRAAVVLMIGVDASGSLLLLSFFERSAGAVDDSRTAAAGAFVWIGLVVYVLVRRRLDAVDGTIAVVTISALLIAEGLGFRDAELRWLCAASLVVAPVAAVMFMSEVGVRVLTLGCMAGAGAITVHIDASVAVRVYTCSTVLAIVIAPVGVVTVLLGRMESARNLARHLAETDQLTGLLNRRGMRDHAPSLVADAQRSGDPVTVMVADLDLFKRINDTFGHDEGDRVLRAVAQAMRDVTRPGSLLVRLGGEELAWIDHFTAAIDVERAAERLRATIAGLVLAGLPSITVSVGVATGPAASGVEPALLITAMLSSADSALYEAKRSGRNRVVCLPHVSRPVDQRRPGPDLPGPHLPGPDRPGPRPHQVGAGA